jgi:hypothetical protein
MSAAYLKGMRCVYSGVVRLQVWAQYDAMEHRGIRYTIRTGIEPDLWSVAIHPGGVESAAKRLYGTRENAEFHARSMIDRWLHKQSAAPRERPSQV